MGKRLYACNLTKEYPNLGKRLSRESIKMEALLQDDYGDPLDCTLTSLSCIFGKEHYQEIESIARRYGYDGNKCGTSPIVIRKITSQFLRKEGLSGTAYSAYFKSLGWSYDSICSLIKRGIPVILNLWKDGRSYYRDHSVVVIGYEEYENCQFLLIYDNWNLGVSMVDYQKLSFVSSINWVDPG